MPMSREIDQLRVARTQVRLNEVMERLEAVAATGDSYEAERLAKLANELLNEPELPRDLVRATARRAALHHLDAAKKATELALDQAFGFALAYRTADCARTLAQVRAFLGAAVRLGAGISFTELAEAKIGSIAQLASSAPSQADAPQAMRLKG